MKALGFLIILMAAFLVSPAWAQQGLSRCGQGQAANAPCTLPLTREDGVGADSGPAFVIRNNVLTVITRASNASVLCCDAIAPLEQIEPGVWGLRVRFPGLGRNRMVAALVPPGETFMIGAGRAPVPMAGVLGEPVTETIVQAWTSPEGTGRHLWRYRPSQCDRQICPLFVLTDGQGYLPFVRMAEGLAAQGEIGPVEIIAVASAEGGSQTAMPRRSLEYLAGAPGGSESFAEHEQRLWSAIEEVTHVSADARPLYVVGFSDGAAFAAHQACVNARVSGAAALSLLWRDPSSATATCAHARTKRVRIFYGSLEPDARAVRASYTSMMQRSGANVRVRRVFGGHSLTTWLAGWHAVLLEWAPPA